MSTDNTKYLELNEIGSTGLQRFGGYVYEEFLKDLKGKRAIEAYTEMSKNDPTVGSMLFAIKMLIRQVEWPVEAFSEDPIDQLNAEFLESCFDDMDQPWTDTIAEILSMLTYGWSWHEIVYKVRLGPTAETDWMRSKYTDGRVGWRKLPIRAQQSLLQWEFCDNGDVEAMIQMAAPNYRITRIPLCKSLLFRTETTKGNPEGQSILRNAYRPWYIKKHIENIEAIGVERDLAGLPIAWVPPDILEPNAPDDRKAILATVKKLVTNIKRDEQEGVIMPLLYDENNNKMYDLTLLSTGSRRQFDTTGIINRYDQRILMTVLADFILLGHTKVGTFSLSSSKTELFATAISAWIGSICEVMNRVAIPQLFALNGLPVDRLPKLTHGDIESQDLGELGTFIQSLSTAGAQIFPNPDLENALLKQAGLPTNQVAHGAANIDPGTTPTAGQNVPRETGIPAMPTEGNQNAQPPANGPGSGIGSGTTAQGAPATR